MHREKEREGGGEREIERERDIAFPPFSLFICMNRLICPYYCQVAFLIWSKERSAKKKTLFWETKVFPNSENIPRQ